MMLVSHAQVHNGQHHENKCLQRHDDQMEHCPTKMHQLPAQKRQAANQQHFYHQQPQGFLVIQLAFEVQPQGSEYGQALRSTRTRLECAHQTRN